MYNYEHETNKIKDRLLKNYVFYDYFHDSLITEISILDEGKTLCLELSCEREWPEHNWSKYAEDKNYLYKMFFMNCEHLEYERSNIGTYAEYINGRFKNSEKLKEINRNSRNNYLHLRIQLADGYINLVFRKFILEKLTGNIELPKRIFTDWHFNLVKRRFTNKSIKEIRSIAFSGEFPLRTYALEYLWAISDESIYDLALNALEDEDAVIPAVFILGELGNKKCIEDLCKIYNMSHKNSIFMRHIKDAIEKIQFKF